MWENLGSSCRLDSRQLRSPAGRSLVLRGGRSAGAFCIRGFKKGFGNNYTERLQTAATAL